MEDNETIKYVEKKDMDDMLRRFKDAYSKALKKDRMKVYRCDSLGGSGIRYIRNGKNKDVDI